MIEVYRYLATLKPTNTVNRYLINQVRRLSTERNKMLRYTSNIEVEYKLVWLNIVSILVYQGITTIDKVQRIIADLENTGALIEYTVDKTIVRDYIDAEMYELLNIGEAHTLLCLDEVYTKKAIFLYNGLLNKHPKPLVWTYGTNGYIYNNSHDLRELLVKAMQDESNADIKSMLRELLFENTITLNEKIKVIRRVIEPNSDLYHILDIE